MEDLKGRKVPDGWIFVDKPEDKSLKPYYLCPATGQQFNTYPHLMRYVTYAKSAQVSIYDPDFYSKDLNGGIGKRRTKSAMKQKLHIKPKKRAHLFSLKPNLSAQDDRMRLGSTWRTEDEYGAGEDSSDSGSDLNDPTYLPRIGPGSGSRTTRPKAGQPPKIIPEPAKITPDSPKLTPEPPKIIQYQRRNKLKNQVIRPFPKIGEQQPAAESSNVNASISVMGPEGDSHC